MPICRRTDIKHFDWFDLFSTNQICPLHSKYLCNECRKNVKVDFYPIYKYNNNKIWSDERYCSWCLLSEIVHDDHTAIKNSHKFYDVTAQNWVD